MVLAGPILFRSYKTNKTSFFLGKTCASVIILVLIYSSMQLKRWRHIRNDFFECFMPNADVGFTGYKTHPNAYASVYILQRQTSNFHKIHLSLEIHVIGWFRSTTTHRKEKNTFLTLSSTFFGLLIFRFSEDFLSLLTAQC